GIQEGRKPDPLGSQRAYGHRHRRIQGCGESAGATIPVSPGPISIYVISKYFILKDSASCILNNLGFYRAVELSKLSATSIPIESASQGRHNPIDVIRPLHRHSTLAVDPPNLSRRSPLRDGEYLQVKEINGGGIRDAPLT